MKPKKPQECWMPMVCETSELSDDYRDGMETALALISTLGDSKEKKNL